MVMTSTMASARRARRVNVTEARSVWQRLDWALVLATGALLGIGTLLVWSSTAGNDALTGGESTAFATRQLVNIGIGVALCAAVVVTDHRWVRLLTPLVYVGGVVGLVVVLSPLGAVVNGSRSWIVVGGLSVQPAEFAKLGMIGAMALLLAERAEARRSADGVQTWDVAGALAIAAVPAVLILAQPDMGTVLVLSAAAFGIVAVAGAGKAWLAGIIGAAVAGCVAVVQFGVLEGYQLDRFAAFLDPSHDPQGAGYNTIQARIAIGNGGVFGQGLFHGSQTQSGFVPEQHTDFVFTVAGEELGLVGAAAVIVLLFVVLWRAIRIAGRADDVFGRLAASGIACWFGFQAFQNIGMCLGIMPVTGVPLPLVSYGGTSMFATLMAVGLLLNIHLRTETSLGLGVILRGRVARSRRY